MHLSRWLPLLLTAACARAAVPQPIVAAAKDVRTQPLVTLSLRGKSVPLLVDTGSALPLVVFPETFPEASGTVEADLRVNAKSPPLADSAVIVASEIAGAKGIVGWPVLKHSVWKLDLPKGSHQFLVAVPEEAKAWTSFPIIAARSSLAIRHPKLGEVFLDSGARRGVCLSPAKWTAWKKSAPAAAITFAEGLSPASPGGAFSNPTAYDARFGLDPLTLNHTNIGEGFFDPSHDQASVLLGLEAFTATTMIVDGPGGRVYFQPVERPGSYKPVPANRLQAAFLPDPGLTNALSVKVLPGGAGEQAGLQNGDLVLELNGSGSPPSFATMHELVRKPGAKAILRIRRGRQSLEVSFVVP